MPALWASLKTTMKIEEQKFHFWDGIWATALYSVKGNLFKGTCALILMDFEHSDGFGTK